MARWTDMVDAKPDPAPLRGGVEVHMLTYEPVGRLSICEGGDAWAGLPSATMLINFSDESGSRAVFGALNQDELFRLKPQYLAREFRPDCAAGSGNHHPTSFE